MFLLSKLFSETPLYFLVQSFWRDEAFSYLLAQKNIIDILITTARDYNPPFYYIILHSWMKIFGSSEISIRSLSILFFGLTLYVIFLFLTNIFKIKSNFFLITYLILFIINPLLNYYAFEGRMYSLFAFLSILSFYSLIRKNKKIYLLSTIMGLYTHYFMIFVLLIQYLIFKSKIQIKAFFCFIPWLLILLTFNQNFISDSFWIEKISAVDFINFIGMIYTGYENNFNFFKNITLLSIFLIFIILFNLIFSIKVKKILKNKNNKKILSMLIFSSIIIPLAILSFSFIKPIFLPRYLIFSTLGLILLIIFIIENHPKYFKLLILLIIFLITLRYNQLQIKERRKENIKKTIYEIEKLMTDKDVLYVINELDFFTVKYYLREKNKKVYIWNKDYEKLPNYIGKSLIKEEDIAYDIPIYPSKAFIIKSFDNYIIQSTY